MMKLFDTDWRNMLGVLAVDGRGISRDSAAETPAAMAVETAALVIAAAVAVETPICTSAAESCGAKYTTAAAIAMIATALTTLPIAASCQMRECAQGNGR
ncbi:hypothetical protein HH800_02370 [Sphingobium yanoikuyae]|uniref:Uncharacterized protein n=1 Tax=Sphingobium yanoikuyae TaxID=13690 RepID=A0A6M4G3J4_SPHYA|nr:hypothetical protein [Sphingobium yanoikuyae]QJR01144.1 hypothetical protein HH800_02370 [Sphingobium yanoikuyae]